MDPKIVTLNLELGISSEFLSTRFLCECHEASCLQVAEIGPDGKEHLLTPAAASAWRNLAAAAREDDIVLFIVSAFRSIKRQTEIVRSKLESGIAIDEILTVVAPPGFSEHHTGRAIDISTPGVPALQIEFENTHAFAWLDAHAAEFGYRLSYPRGNRFGYQYEPWHWCFDDPIRCDSAPDCAD